MGIGSIGSSYFNFILGTGSDDVGKIIKRQIKNRKVNNQSYLGALCKGTKKGIGYSHAVQKKAGGFVKSLKNGFKAIPQEFKNGKGFFGKIKGGIKGLGKAMPALFAFLTIAGEIPNAYKATKEKGIGAGLKELGKAGVRLTTGALFGAIGSAILPIGGSIVGYMIGDWIGTKLVGKSYTEQQEAKKEENKPSSPSMASQGKTVPTGAYSGYTAFPSIDEDDFGPHKPYANIFYNYPGAYADFGARMPDQAAAMYGVYGTYPGIAGVPNTNQSTNLLKNVNETANLLKSKETQEFYSMPNKTNTGSKLNIEK